MISSNHEMAAKVEDTDSERLLNDASSTASELEFMDSIDRKTLRRIKSRYPIFGVIMMFLLISSNVACHEWTGLLEQESDGTRYRDEEWGTNLFPDNGGVVALSRDFAREHDLPDAAVTPEDPSKMIYLVAGYHQLHCLSVIRDSIYYLNGTMPVWPDPGGFIWDHILHCVEAVRQGLTCFLDPTLINLDEKWPGIPNGQKHVCRNRDAMYQWSTEHGHAIPVDPRSGGKK
ncbi:hypothetical protein ONS95_006490 [Cadophora gregata]|uniref:uncharacterized protein n=1 Tax=Cadophora gregata TaxID=51156 RepID=UPI0026DC144A|nr:uncharacterized protein ONS95_006490 [Cadophora gregata]KAK0101313.1 hypothetical protein ONS95_006490 [Cadophora gregata]